MISTEIEIADCNSFVQFSKSFNIFYRLCRLRFAFLSNSQCRGDKN